MTGISRKSSSATYYSTRVFASDSQIIHEQTKNKLCKPYILCHVEERHWFHFWYQSGEKCHIRTIDRVCSGCVKNKYVVHGRRKNSSWSSQRVRSSFMCGLWAQSNVCFWNLVSNSIRNIVAFNAGIRLFMESAISQLIVHLKYVAWRGTKAVVDRTVSHYHYTRSM